MSIWTGRVDIADGPSALRWHQMVRPLAADSPPGIVLIGFACDEGVRRNGGRVGAKDGPVAIRKALANFAWHHERPVYDAGDVRCDDGDMEGAQSRLAEVVAGVISSGHRPLVLGGGHETAWGTFQGIVAAKPQSTVGVINIDAHLDLRADEPGHSGTPFNQIARWCQANNRGFHYVCIGVSKPANTAALIARARELHVVDWADSLLNPWELDIPLGNVVDIIGLCDTIHLSIDFDVLPAAIMPAVSAPASRGVPLEAIEMILSRVITSGKVVAVDVVELNPLFDIDGRGGRVAARLVWEATEDWDRKEEWGWK